MKSLLRQAAKVLYPRGSVRRVWRGARSGCRYVVRDAMGVMFALGSPDEEACAAYRKLIRPGDTVLDVGANRGQMSLIFAKLVGRDGHVVAIEPVPDVAGDLSRNCDLNGLRQVSVICAAAAATCGELTFHFPAGRQTQGKLADVEPTYDNEATETFQVRSVTLDSLVEERGLRPDFIKIDVEGAAAEVVGGAEKLLAEHRPKIFLEQHGPEERAAARDLAVRFGYRVESMEGQVVGDPTTEFRNPLVFLPQD